jgi:hypothetical protein
VTTLTTVARKNTTNSRSTNVRPATADALDRMACESGVARAEVATDLLVAAGRATPVIKLPWPADKNDRKKVPIKFRVQALKEPYVDLGPRVTGMNTCAWRTAILAVAEDPERAIEEARAFLRQVKAVARLVQASSAPKEKLP